MSEGEEVRQWNRAAAANLGRGEWEGGGEGGARALPAWDVTGFSISPSLQLRSGKYCKHTTCAQIPAAYLLCSPARVPASGTDTSILRRCFCDSSVMSQSEKYRLKGRTEKKPKKPKKKPRRSVWVPLQTNPGLCEWGAKFFRMIAIVPR